VESDSQANSIHEARGFSWIFESICFLTIIAGALWFVLGPSSADNHDMFYVFFLPIIWIAVRRGLRGATTGIFILDIGNSSFAQIFSWRPSAFRHIAIPDADPFLDRTGTGGIDQ